MEKDGKILGMGPVPETVRNVAVVARVKSNDGGGI